MEDFERMQYREYQRQQLLEELKSMVWNQIGEEGIRDERMNENTFYWGLITSTTGYIHNMTPEFEDQVGNVFYSSALNLVRTQVILKIEAFTPVREERQIVAVEFLKFAVDQMSQPIHRENTRLSVPPARDKFLRQVGLYKMERIPS